jgi:hypothetical protein
MNDDISRREWVVLATGAGAASVVASEAAGAVAPQPDSSSDRCPYFDQPLFCKGRKYCQ